ncbi:MAG: thiol reductant ABC exporter subunit CydD [Scrofimicrobium sp.]
MKPLDPRLLKYARSARRYIVEIAVLGLLTAALVIAQAFLISASLSPVVTGGEPLSGVLPTILGLAAVVGVRALLVYLREARAHRAADQTIAELRAQVLAKSARLGPRWRARNATENATLVTRGLDDLDPYFVKFLPQLLLVMTATPLALVTILFLDFWSALIALLTIPLIPIFMVLIGKMTVGFSSKKLLAMERLGAQLLDLLTGLPTLRALGREKGPREHLVRLSKQNTRTTMQTLRVAFLSGGVLEFLATLSVALVAVQVGMRMVSGELSLFVGLVIIMLAPEVFEPLRQVGAQFHASTNGVAAAEQCFTILETPERESGTVEAARAGTSPIRIEGLSVASRGSWAPHDLNGTIKPGRITALAGASGGGKSTTVQVLLGLEPATRGMVRAESSAGELVSVDEFALDSWYRGISWIPQHPTISPGTVIGNVLPESTAPEVTPALERAARATGFGVVIDSLPHGWNTEIGLGGIGLSVGQRQRLALTRTLVEVPTLLVLDEPTAHLDAMNEEQIARVLKELRGRGTTIIVIAHRQAILRASDTVLNVESRPATEAEMKLYPQLLDDYELEDLSGELPGFLDAASLPEDDKQGLRLFEEQREGRQ